MFDSVKLISILIYRFIVIFLCFSLIFISTFYLEYKFLYADFSIFDYQIYYNAYIYAFPLSLVLTFIKISLPLKLDVIKIGSTLKSSYMIVFLFIIFFSYVGFLAASNFNSFFIKAQQKEERVLRDGVVHYFDDELMLYSRNINFFGFKGLLSVTNKENRSFSYYGNSSEGRDKILNINNKIPLGQKIYDKLIYSIFDDVRVLSEFILSLGYISLLFNIMGFALLLFSFSYVFNLVLTSNLILFLYPVVVFLFFKIHNIYSGYFVYNFVLIVGENILSEYIPFIFCILTFFSTYLFAFMSKFINENKENSE